MIENYIQYAGGYQKDNINETDIEKAIADIQRMDDEHGAFWVSVTTNDENVIEVNKDLRFQQYSKDKKLNIRRRIGKR